MNFDYSKLRGKIREIFKTQNSFAEVLGMSATSLSEKLNNKVEFTQKEIENSVELLKIEKNDIPIYFFTLEVQETEQIKDEEGCE